MARFDGSPIVLLLDDGRRVQLQKDLAFIDDDALRWDVPANAIVDGASIPQVLWTAIGGPFEGRYRNASIIHDWYCDLRSRPWQKVHRMFFEAMIASGVGAALAKVMYAGVYMGGPRWSETVVSNVRLLAKEYLSDSTRANRPLHYPMTVDEFGRPERRGPYADEGLTRITRLYHYPLDEAAFADLQHRVRADASLDSIEAAIDARTTAIQPVVSESKRPA